MDRNAHIKDYLTYYVDFSRPPGFAVLLSGPWGIGKTRLVDDFTGTYKDKGLRYVRVSLYGLTSLAEIDDALLRALYPLLDNRYADWAGRAGKVAMKDNLTPRWLRSNAPSPSENLLKPAKSFMCLACVYGWRGSAVSLRQATR